MAIDTQSSALSELPVELATLLLSTCLSALIVLIFLLIARPPRWTAMSSGIRARPWALGHVGLLIATVLCGLCTIPLLPWLAGRLGWQDWQFPEYSGIALGLVFMLLPCLVTIRLVMRLEHISLKDGFGIEPGHALQRLASGIFLGMAVTPLVWLAALVGQLLLQPLELQGDQQSVTLMVRSASMAPWYAQVSVGAMTVLLGPAIEELVFRGVAFPAAAGRLGFLPGAVLISLFFAVLHVEITTFAPLFAFSMALCFAYAVSGSILVPFAMHATFNLIQIALLPFDKLQ